MRSAIANRISLTQRIAIFANPIAGRGRARAIAERLHNRFIARGWHATVILDRPDRADPSSLADLTAAVSIGGDGTLRSVVERLTDGGATPGPGILAVSMGTANLMARHLRIPLRSRDVEQLAVRAIEEHRVAHLDVGLLTGSSPAGELGRLFLMIVGVGIDGQIVHALDRIRQGPISFFSYIPPAWNALSSYSFPPIEVEVDGRVIFPMAPAIAFAANIPEYGTGFPIVPGARSNDGLLDVCVLPARRKTDLILHAVLALLGRHVKSKGVVQGRGKSIQIRAKEPVAVQADGDPAGFTTISLEILPTRAALILC